MAKFKIGEHIKFTEDFIVESCLGNKKTILKDSVGIVSSDGMLHMRNGMILPLEKEDVITDEYDVENITKYLVHRLCGYYGEEDFTEMLDGYDIGIEEFKTQITEALEEIF
jgi:hypothetical protein